MEFNDFCNEIRDNIGEYLLGYDFDNIQLQEVTHNNNTPHTGLVISREDVNVAPTIYMEQYYRQYQDTGDMDAVIKEIAETYKASLESTNDLRTEIFNQQEFDEDGEYDFTTENKTCFSYDAAERIKQRYIEYGYTDINIDDTEISIKDFWGSEKFIKGDTPHQERTNTEEALATYKVYQRPGATIYEKIGMALEKIDTQDMIQYFKDKIPGGEHLIRDFVENQIIANEVNKERERNEAGRGIF